MAPRIRVEADQGRAQFGIGSRLAARGYYGHHRVKISHDELGLDPDDAVASTRELAIPACVGTLAPSVIATINFNDQPNGWGVEVNDEA